MTTTQTFRQTEQESSRRQWLRQTMLSSGLLLVPGLGLAQSLPAYPANPRNQTGLAAGAASPWPEAWAGSTHSAKTTAPVNARSRKAGGMVGLRRSFWPMMGAARRRGFVRRRIDSETMPAFEPPSFRVTSA